VDFCNKEGKLWIKRNACKAEPERKDLPDADPKDGCKASLSRYPAEPEGAEVVVVEGTHVLCTPELVELFDIRVFVDTPADIRFIRRLLRDQVERGRTAESVIAQYLATVRPGHERLTEPSRVKADFIVADATAAVRLEDPQAVVRLAAPVLAHPLLAPLVER